MAKESTAFKSRKEANGERTRPRKKYKRKTLYPRVSRLRRLANDRERERSQHIQTAFGPHQDIIWKNSVGKSRQALPKIQVLRAAIGYIELLDRVIDGKASEDESYAVRQRIESFFENHLEQPISSQNHAKQAEGGFPEYEHAHQEPTRLHNTANVTLDDLRQDSHPAPAYRTTCRSYSESSSSASSVSTTSSTCGEPDHFDAGDLTFDLASELEDSTKAECAWPTDASISFDFDKWLQTFDAEILLGDSPDDLLTSSTPVDFEVDLFSQMLNGEGL